MAPGDREQAIQGALTRYFGGAELSDLRVERERAVGAPLILRYRLKAPGFARLEEGRLIVPPVTFPAALGRRYVQLNRRRTPLFIERTERNRVKVELTLPRGFRLHAPVGEVRTASAFGWVTRKERQSGAVAYLEEDYRLTMARVSPARYDDFSQFAGEVDLLQSRDLVLEPAQRPGDAARAGAR
jgi:hypothetical protein